MSCSTSQPVATSDELIRELRGGADVAAGHIGERGRFGLWTRAGGALSSPRAAPTSRPICRRAARPSGRST